MEPEIDMSESGMMLWITEPEGRLSITGGENGAAILTVWTPTGEADIDLSPLSAGAVARCLAHYAGDDLALVERQALHALVMAAGGAEAVLDVLNLGKPLRQALRQLVAKVDPAPGWARGEEG